MVWGDNPGQLNVRKGYGAFNRLYYFVVIQGTDGVHPGSNCGCLQQLFPLMTRLVLVVGWASQFVINGGPGLGRELRTGRYSFSYQCDFYRTR